MITTVLGGLFDLLFNSKKERTFESYLVLAAWVVALILLGVSIPHSVTIIQGEETGPDAGFKATLLASVIEVTPALWLLIALHGDLSKSEKWAMGLMAVPFVLLAVHIQIVSYTHNPGWPIQPFELGLILPYGIAGCAIAVAMLWHHVKGRENLIEVWQARLVEAVAGARAAAAEREAQLIEQARNRIAELQEVIDRMGKTIVVSVNENDPVIIRLTQERDEIVQERNRIAEERNRIAEEHNRIANQLQDCNSKAQKMADRLVEMGNQLKARETELAQTRELVADPKPNGLTSEMLDEWFKRTNPRVAAENRLTLTQVKEKILEITKA